MTESTTKATNGANNARFFSSIRDGVRDTARDVGRFNLLCVGNTGAGKSTLINAIFGSDAHTGIGRPVTMGTTEYVHPNLPLTVLDTRGIEVGEDRQQISKRLVDEITSRREKPVNDQVHVAWYCVRSTDGRLEDGQIEVIKAIQSAGVPVILVLTRVPGRDGRHHPDAVAFAAEIDKLNLSLVGGHPVLTAAIDDLWSGDTAHGLDDLLDASFQAAPEGQHSALIAAQQIDNGRKQKAAWAVIAGACTLAAAAAASPIPFSDAALLVPIQVGMLAGVTALWGLNIDKSTQATVIGSALLTNGATFIGRELVAGLLKFVPFAGWLLGSALSASVAVALTTAIGAAWIAVLTQLAKNPDLVPNMDSQQIRDMFTVALRETKGQRSPTF